MGRAAGPQAATQSAMGWVRPARDDRSVILP